MIRGVQGVGVRRVDLLAGIRHIKDIKESALHVRNIRLGFKPDPARVQKARTPILSNFSYVVEVKGEGQDFGKPGTAFITVTSSRNLSRDEIEYEATKAYDTADREYKGQNFVEAQEYQIAEARKR